MASRSSESEHRGRSSSIGATRSRSAESQHVGEHESSSAVMSLDRDIAAASAADGDVGFLNVVPRCDQQANASFSIDAGSQRICDAAVPAQRICISRACFRPVCAHGRARLKHLRQHARRGRCEIPVPPTDSCRASSLTRSRRASNAIAAGMLRPAGRARRPLRCPSSTAPSPARSEHDVRRRRPRSARPRTSPSSGRPGRRSALSPPRPNATSSPIRAPPASTPAARWSSRSRWLYDADRALVSSVQGRPLVDAVRAVVPDGGRAADPHEDGRDSQAGQRGGPSAEADHSERGAPSWCASSSTSCSGSPAPTRALPRKHRIPTSPSTWLRFRDRSRRSSGRRRSPRCARRPKSRPHAMPNSNGRARRTRVCRPNSSACVLRSRPRRRSTRRDPTITTTTRTPPAISTSTSSFARPAGRSTRAAIASSRSPACRTRRASATSTTCSGATTVSRSLSWRPSARDATRTSAASRPSSTPTASSSGLVSGR